MRWIWARGRIYTLITGLWGALFTSTHNFISRLDLEHEATMSANATIKIENLSPATTKEGLAAFIGARRWLLSMIRSSDTDLPPHRLLRRYPVIGHRHNNAHRYSDLCKGVCSQGQRQNKLQAVRALMIVFFVNRLLPCSMAALWTLARSRSVRPDEPSEMSS